ncbi:MAG: TonB-dependent receptor plug domain-containing protein, partial [Bacteroidaceae bacterium]|nr:TonB-dependent receptor plug domain-containing protein [Bacteroidaceae bacterium]
MKRFISTTALVVGLMPCVAQTEGDSIHHVLGEASVIATRATTQTPIAFTNLSRDEISRNNHGQDIPYLINSTPSVVSTSDAGAGIGYTSVRIRGVDATRINVTANGIPVNDAESHSVFWVNMPDFASSVKDIQLQRGVGTSTNGAGAFGASMNLQTADFSHKPYAEVSASFGSFLTHKETLRLGTGLLKGHWTFDLRLSNIG